MLDQLDSAGPMHQRIGATADPRNHEFLYRSGSFNSVLFESTQCRSDKLGLRRASNTMLTLGIAVPDGLRKRRNIALVGAWVLSLALSMPAGFSADVKEPPAASQELPAARPESATPAPKSPHTIQEAPAGAPIASQELPPPKKESP